MLCDARDRDQALVEQLRQQQLELAKAPVVETPASIPETVTVETPTPAVQTAEAELVSSPPEGITPHAAEGEGGELPLGAGTGGAEVEGLETTRTDEVAAEEQTMTPSLQDPSRDSEESRKRRESMRNNAEQVCYCLR